MQYVTDEEIPNNESTAENASLQTNVPTYSIVLIACIITVSVVQLTTDLNMSIDAAGFDKPAFINNRDYWRILTGGALHGGFMHLAFNSYALYSFGNLIEFLSNKAHLAIVFLISIIGGGLLSLLAAPAGTSVGASGGVIGFLGYLAIYAYKRRQLLSSDFLRSLLINIGFIAIYGIALAKGIDNFAHLGGLAAGAIYGFFQIPSDLQKDPRIVSSKTGLIGIISLGFFIVVSIFSILLILQIIKL
jgi:membrane associated rhomboid family serine protease